MQNSCNYHWDHVTDHGPLFLKISGVAFRLASRATGKMNRISIGNFPVQDAEVASNYHYDVKKKNP